MVINNTKGMSIKRREISILIDSRVQGNCLVNILSCFFIRTKKKRNVMSSVSKLLNRRFIKST